MIANSLARSTAPRGGGRRAQAQATVPASGAVVLDLAARQRMLNERFVKELIAGLVGAPSEPQTTLGWLRSTATALAEGGLAAKTLGPEPVWVELPPPSTPGLSRLFEQECAALDALERDADALAEASADEAQRRAGVVRLLESSRHFFTVANQATTELAQHLDAERAMLERRLSDALGRMAEESGHVTDSAVRLRDTSSAVTAATTATASAAQAVATASEQVDRNIGAVAAATEQMSACIREIARNAAQASQVAGTAVRTTQHASDTITRLGDAGKQVDRVVTMIATIARQTNLLALNAMIEAARAGESGKGFTVVANEVKQLSRETAEATSAVGNQVEAIHHEITAVVGSLAEIRGVVEKVDAIAGMIAAAVEEQTATTREIARSVSDAAAGASDIARNIHGVAESAARASSAATAGSDATVGMTRATDELRSLLASLGASGAGPAR